MRNSATNVVPKGSLLIVTRTGVGKLAIAPFDIAISQDITGVVLDSEKAKTDYVYWYLGSISSRLKQMAQGTSINGLLREDLELIALPIPPLPEQKKIADILTTVDEAIEKTSQIIEKEKEVKKGLMQTLLTHGIGHKKFKKTEIGEIPEEWRVGQDCLILIQINLWDSLLRGNTYNTVGDRRPMLNGPTEFTDYFPGPVQFTTQPLMTCKTETYYSALEGGAQVE